jgi:hypothetical protein
MGERKKRVRGKGERREYVIYIYITGCKQIEFSFNSKPFPMNALPQLRTNKKGKERGLLVAQEREREDNKRLKKEEDMDVYTPKP